MFERLDHHENTFRENQNFQFHETIKMHLFLDFTIPRLKISKMNSIPDIGYFRFLPKNNFVKNYIEYFGKLKNVITQKLC